MNIKLKAFLITITILVGIFGSVYTAVIKPLVLGIVVSLVVFYGMYKMVLDTLERKNPQ
jgi:hypothetical protein